MRFEVHPREVVHETIEGEAIVIQLRTGFYYSLDGAGAEIWGALVAGCTPEEVVQLLQTRYNATPGAIEASVSTLVKELRGEALIAEAPSRKSGTAKAPRNPAPDATVFEPPVLYRYTDMADFVLVDPIHEVAETGWPMREVAP